MIFNRLEKLCFSYWIRKDTARMIEKAKKEHLYTLNLKNRGLKKIPSEVFRLERVRCLSLKGNLIEQIPAEIGNLVNLKELDLSNNRISKLPKEIGRLKNLEDLYLQGNKLDTLPKSIFNLANLTRITLHDSTLKDQKAKDFVDTVKNKVLSYSFYNNETGRIEKKIAQLESEKFLRGYSNAGLILGIIKFIFFSSITFPIIYKLVYLLSGQSVDFDSLSGIVYSIISSTIVTDIHMSFEDYSFFKRLIKSIVFSLLAGFVLGIAYNIL